ncbi:MAG: nucleotidyltransferase domain-containing protein [Bdellovibrionota bacterium]
MTKLILFGSRARESNTPKSDYDVAVEAPGMSDIEWNEWALNVRENVPTLCGLDLVKVHPDLFHSIFQAIQSQGKVIYERQ